MFTESIVVDVVTDLSYYTQDVLKELIPQILEEDRAHFCDEPAGQTMDEPGENVYYVRAPRNTVLGIEVSAAKSVSYDAVNAEDTADVINNQKKEVGQLKVYYPFFSSHMCLPVKPGESVWTFTAGERNYWMTRVSQCLPCEDPNFTHRERRWDPVRQVPVKFTQGSEIIELKSEEGAPTEIEAAPSFPLGAAFGVRDSNRKEDVTEDFEDEKIVEEKYNEGDLTFPTLDATSGVTTRSYYDYIYKNNSDGSNVANEPVPRINKRPGDLVLQGSNNSSIVLGTERGWTQSDRPDGTRSNVRLDDDNTLGQMKGSVDIVAGRGRILKDLSEVKDTDPIGTSPRVVENTRKDFETNKNPGLDKNIVDTSAASEDSGHLKYAAEGDPDFLHDASRVYVSMNSDPDDLLYGSDSNPYPKISTDGEGVEVQNSKGAASVIVKSDEIRIVARKKTEDDLGPEVNGSIKIVKEGTKDEDQAVIMIQPDGTIMIDGPRIVVGSGIEKGNGEGDQVFIGRDASESVVLGNTLTDSVLLPLLQAIRDNAPTFSTGASPNVLNPAVLAAVMQVLSALGDPGGTNTILSKNAKTK